MLQVCNRGFGYGGIISGVEVAPGLGLEPRLKLMALGLGLGHHSFFDFAGPALGSAVRVVGSSVVAKGPASDPGS